MLPTNSHTYLSPCVPCARHRSHVDSSWFRLVQRVRMTLGRSSQAQNIAASWCLVEVRLFQVHSFRRSCFSRRLRKGCFVGFVVAFTPLSHGPNCRCLPGSRSVPWPDRYVDNLLMVGPPFWHKFPSECPSSGRFTIRNQDVLTGLHPKTDEKNQVPSCLLLSFDLSSDPLDTTLFLRTRICPCGVRDLATVRTVRMVLSHQAQLCLGSARWWRAQSSKQWSSILVVSAFDS